MMAPSSQRGRQSPPGTTPSTFLLPRLAQKTPGSRPNVSIERSGAGLGLGPRSISIDRKWRFGSSVIDQEEKKAQADAPLLALWRNAFMLSFGRGRGGSRRRGGSRNEYRWGQGSLGSRCRRPRWQLADAC